MRTAIPFLVASLIFGCKSPADVEEADEPATEQRSTSTTDEPAPDSAGTSPPAPAARPAAIEASWDGQRPQFSPDGTRLVYHGGEEGSRQLFVATVADDTVSALGPFEGDNVDPTWSQDGTRIVFASNRDGDYDLYAVDAAGGDVEQVTDDPGDERHPTVAPVLFGFYAVRNGVCGGPPGGKPVDGYEKVLFERRYDDRSEIWFTSMKPPGEFPWPRRRGKQDPVELSRHGTHRGRVSDASARCGSPRFGGDGVSAVWTCEDGGSVVYDARARWDQSFAAALKSVKTDPPQACVGWDSDPSRCLPQLKKRYARYPGEAVSDGAQNLRNPSVSANQVVLLADDGEQIVSRPRTDDGTWSPLKLADGSSAAGARAVWSPTGTHVAFDRDAKIAIEPTDFYLQRVRNLRHFPELFGEGESELLHTNRFVVRPGQEKEFYELHEKLRYDRTPQFISTHVALQAFRDEFLRLLQGAEAKAADQLRLLSEALWKHYAARHAKSGSAIDRYYAIYFATAWVPLEAAKTMKKMNYEDHLATQWGRESLTDEEKERIDERSRPVAERLPAHVERVTAKLPPALRSDVQKYAQRMTRHQGIERVSVPSYERPLKIDFSQFKIRGAYAENDLGGYFLAMKWYGFMPLPFDASLKEFAAALQSVKVGDTPASDVWRSIDGLVGSFMGKPVDATVDDLLSVRAKQPALFNPFKTKAVRKRLAEIRGKIAIRDASTSDRKLHLTFFPQRAGLDVTFFRQLTHKRVKMRGMPTSLDVFATLGIDRARQHAIEAEPEDRVEEYRQVLDRLVEKTPQPESDQGYWNTDIYHSWLAALVVLARSYDVPDGSMIEFAESDAWHDRQLFSALAGYTQLKHAAVLYAMQDMGIECDGASSYYVAIEQPLLPEPRGFVDPNPEFYAALARLAERVYARLHDDPDGPTADQWQRDDTPHLNALNFARDLETIARAELEGNERTPEQYRWIEFIGADLEMLTMGKQLDTTSFSTGGDARAERGVALVTDIHTNVQRQQALHVGIGRILDLWVVTPHDVGQTMTRGGILSFYEFTEPMSDRMTDAEWESRLEDGKPPPLPNWTKSFIEQ